MSCEVTFPRLRLRRYSKALKYVRGVSERKRSVSEQDLIEKLRALPPERQAEVETFIDFLSAKIRRGARSIALNRPGAESRRC
jgi:hypothetical protein